MNKMNEAGEMLQTIVDKVDAYRAYAQGYEEGEEAGRNGIEKAIAASLCIGCGLGVIITLLLGSTTVELVQAWMT